MIVPDTRKAYDFFHRATRALSRVEAAGIRIDTEYLRKTMDSTGERIRKNESRLREDKVWKTWKQRFRNPNLDSVTQLGTVLTSLGYKSKGRTEKGNVKWDEAALDKIDLPFVRLYNDTKKLKKVLGTYLRGIERELVGDILHPSFNLAGGLDDDQKGGAMSYRGSSSNPNFQNMPIRNKLMGELIRKCFISRKGFRLAEVDFGTIEVRIAACCCLDPNLISFVKNPKKDMHREAASRLFMIPEKDLIAHKDHYKKTLRDSAKNQFVFPEFYGSWFKNCATHIWASMLRREWKMAESDVLVRDHLKSKGVYKLGKFDPERDRNPDHGTFMHHVQQVEKHLWDVMFPVFKRWRKTWYNQYLETGEVPMPTGFVAKGLFLKNQVLNLPIQGPAFHCLLWSIIELQEEFERLGLRSLIVGQIHDCVLIDIHESEVQQIPDLCKDIMTRRLLKAWEWICVPLEIEVDVVPKGMSWHDKKLWVQDETGLWAEKA